MLAGVVLVCAAPAQLPHIGDIDFYGLRKIPAEQILAAAHLASGDSVPASRGDLEGQIASIPGVDAAHVQTVCCEGNRVALFIGIEESGAPAATFHEPPSGKSTLPPDLMTQYREYEGALLRAELNGAASQSASAIPAPAADPTVHGDEIRFRAFAARHTLLLRAELRTGADAEERAAAATVIGYATDKRAVVDDLLFALQDPDEGVRTNAARSLAAIAAVGRRTPALGIHVSSARFVELLDSVVLSDRVESTKALLVLTAGKSAPVLDLIRQRALPSLAEMARWKTLRYAQPPFVLLGRVAGLTDAQVQQSWDKGDREPVIQQALASAANKPRE
jgi:hypothetical protein